MPAFHNPANEICDWRDPRVKRDIMNNRIMGYLKSVAIVVMLLSTAFPLMMLMPFAMGTVEVRYADKNFANHQDIVHAVAWSPNSTEVVSGGNDENAILWNWDTTITRVVYTGHSDYVLSVAYSHDGTKVASGDASGSVKIWSSQNGVPVKGFNHGTGASYVYDVAWSPNADRVVTCGSDHNAKIWNMDPTEPNPLETFSGHTNNVNSVEYSPDGSKVVSGGDDNKVWIWKASDGSEIRKIDGHPLSVKAVAWSPDGTKIVSGSEDNSAKIWDAATGNEILKFTGHSDTVLSVDWSPDSTKVVSGSANGTIKIWDAANGYEYVEFSGHNNAVNSVAWAPDGDKIAAASDDNRATIWKLIAPPSTPRLTIPIKNVYRGETISIIGEAEAYFTPTEQLNPFFQYKFHSDESWTSFTDPVFVDGKWQVEFTPDYPADLGYYHVRVRFQEENGLYSVWTQRDSGIQVHNNVPNVQITAAPLSIYRAQQGFLAVDVDDLESEPFEMSVAAQYSKHTLEEWETNIFSTPYYNATRNLWICNFTFPGSASINFSYDLRVKCSDPDGGHSSWNMLDTPIWIINNPPKVTRLSFSPPQVFRGNTTTIWIDAEDPESGTAIELPEVEIRYSKLKSDWLPLEVNEHIKGSNFTAEYITTKENELGLYDVRVKVKDTVDAKTNWFFFNNSLKVINNLPVASGDYLSLAMYNDKKEFFDLSSFVTDFEDDPGMLLWQIDGKPVEMVESDSPLFSAVMEDTVTLSVEPPLNARTGKAKIRFSITDSDGGETFKEIYIELFDGADCPLIGVTQVSPADGLIEGDTTVSLNWDINYTKGGPTYKVYLGEFEDQLELIYESEGGTTYVYDEMEDGHRYYWKVTARLYDIPRTFESPVWSFTVNVGYEVKHELEMYFDETNMNNMIPGEVVTLNLTIINNGNVLEDVKFQVTGTLRNHVEMVDTVRLSPDKTKVVQVTVTWPSLDSSTLTISAAYGDEGKEASARVIFKGKAVATEESSSAAWVWIAVILIIIVGGVGAYVVFRIKKREDEESATPEPTQFVMPPQDSGFMGGGSMSGPPGPPGPPPSRPFQQQLDVEEIPEPEATESEKVQEKIVEIIGLLKVLEHHKSALEADLLCIEDPTEKQEITTKIEAIKTQEVELQQQAVILGEKAQSMVKDKEMDDIFGGKTEAETKALPVKTSPVPTQKMLPVKTMPVPTEKAVPAKTLPIAAKETETGEEEKEAEAIVEKEISPQEKEKMKVVDQLNELQEMLDKAKENGLDVSAIEVLRDKSRAFLEEDKLEEAENNVVEAKKALEEAMEAALPETLRLRILELSSALDKARGYKLSIEDEADALVVIKSLKDAEKYREAVSTIKGIYTSVAGKLLLHERQVRSEIITEARIEMGTFELEGRSNVDELWSYLNSAKESTEIDEFEEADIFLEQYNEAKQEEPAAVTPVAAPVAKTLPVPPSVIATMAPAAQAAPSVSAAAITPAVQAPLPRKRVKRVRRKPKKIVKRKVKRVKTSPPPQSVTAPAAQPMAAPAQAAPQAMPAQAAPQATPAQAAPPAAVEAATAQAVPPVAEPATAAPQVAQAQVEEVENPQ